MSRAVPYLLPLLTLLLWAVHAGLSLSGTGTPRARGVARWSWLAGPPLVWLGTYAWWAFVLPDAPSNRITDVRPVDVAVLVNLFVGLFVWCLFLLAEPLVDWLGRRRLRDR